MEQSLLRSKDASCPGDACRAQSAGSVGFIVWEGSASKMPAGKKERLHVSEIRQSRDSEVSYPRRKRRKNLISVLLGIMSVLVCTASGGKYASAETRGAVTADTLSLGIISEDPQQKIEYHQDFVNYLAQKLSTGTPITGRVIIVHTPLQLAKLLNERTVDFYVESPYSTVLINERTGAKLLLRRLKGGRTDYQGIIFTAKDSGIRTVEDLLGKIIAFKDPRSTSSYFLPKVLLLKKGLKLTEKFSLDANVSKTEIGYVFGYHDVQNVINWTLLKKVAAGAFGSHNMDALDESKRAQIVVLAETETVPRHLLSVRKDLNQALVSRLKEVLLSIHLDEEGRRVLRKSDKTTKFDLLPGGEDLLYHRITEMMRIFRGQ